MPSDQFVKQILAEEVSEVEFSIVSESAGLMIAGVVVVAARESVVHGCKDGAEKGTCVRRGLTRGAAACSWRR